MNLRFSTLIALIVFGVTFRWLPHPPNFSPIAALALFGGAYLTHKHLSLILPLVVLFLSDLLLGLHSLIPVVYGCFLLTVFLGWNLQNKLKGSRIIAFSITSSMIFFVVTNFAVWAFSGLYPLTASGLTACYVAAIPFFANEVVGTLVYSSILFGAFEILQAKIPALAKN